jgi:DNA recombination protein RmuC
MAPAAAVTREVLLVERIVCIVLGLLVGVALGWLLRALKKGVPDTRVEGELRLQLAAREAELNSIRAAAAEAGAAKAAAEASRSAAEQLAAVRAQEAAAAGQQLTGVRERLAAQDTDLAVARAEAQKRAEQLVELRTANEQALRVLRDQFKALAAEALSANTPEFLRLANETFAKFQATASGDLAQRQESVAALVKPLEEQLRAYQQRLQQAEAQQTDVLGQVKQQLDALATQSLTLSGETQRLRVVLSSNQARGRWGEETLRRVIEAAGLSVHCDFTEQVKEGDSKPDLIVRLPGDRFIIVDSKVPDLDFLNALNEADGTKRAEALAAHAKKLREAIKALADRDYPKQFPQALDHVVLFLPAESLFSAALEGDRELLMWAAERHILLATPASLIALLRSVAVSWQQHEQSANAREIAAAARELYERVAKFTEHFGRIRDGLEKAARAYNDAVGSYETRVRPGGERLLKLGGGTESKTLAEVPLMDATLRLPPVGE